MYLHLLFDVSLQTSEAQPSDMSDSFTLVSSIETLTHDDQMSASIQQQQQQQHGVCDDEPVEDAVDDEQGNDFDLQFENMLMTGTGSDGVRKRQEMLED